MEYYYELKYGSYNDLKSVLIAPSSVKVVQKRWDNGDPIHIPGRGSIPANAIRSFEVTGKVYGGSQKLLEEAAQAFGEPIYVEVDNGKGSAETQIEVKWVKKAVTTDQWQRYYSPSPGYKLLNEESGMALIAFRQPTHQIDKAKVQECTQDEVARLTRM